MMHKNETKALTFTLISFSILWKGGTFIMLKFHLMRGSLAKFATSVKIRLL